MSKATCLIATLFLVLEQVSCQIFGQQLLINALMQSEQDVKSLVNVTASMIGMNKRSNSSEENASSGTNLIKKAWFINLDARQDRRQSMEQQLKELGIDFTRKSAIQVDLNAAQRDSRYASYLKGRLDKSSLVGSSSYSHKSVKKFVVSTYLSHMQVYESILKEGLRNPDDMVLVLEDDVTLKSSLPDSLLRLLPLVPDDWDIIRLSTWGKVRQQDKIASETQTGSSKEAVFKATGPFKDGGDIFYAGMHASLVRAKTLPHLIQHLKATALDDIDSMVTACCDKVKSYVITTPSVDLENTLYSDHPHVPVLLRG